jgi:uncharacterized DUF497 family protein
MARSKTNTIRIYGVRYEWDETKNLRNRQKHDGVSFELAALVFEDDCCLIVQDRIDPRTGEQRWQALGAVHIEPGYAMIVVHACREESNGEEIIRIISARAAEKHEIRRYQEQAMD